MADFSNRSNWDHPTRTTGECVPSFFGSEGGAQFLTTTREGMGGGGPNSDEGTDAVAF
jgi:hypothetical protein